ncbi:restriction endonuclease subunit S, partial [Spirosoma terrae]
MLNRGDVKTRLSPNYYQALKNAQIHSKYPKKRLSSLVDTFSGGTPSKNTPEYWQGDIGWISPKDIKEFYIESAEDFISEKAIEDSSTKLASKGSLVIVVRSGILAHTLPVSVLSNDFAINQDLKAILARDTSLVSEYLAIFLTVFQERLLPIITKHSTTVQSVNSHEFLRLEIVCPPIDVQNEVVELFQNSLAQKRQQEAQAQALLDSIDGYLLGELGVTLPPEPENTIQNRMFKSSWRQMSGSRFDPTFHQGNVYGPIADTPFDLVPLRKLVSYFQTGFAAGRGDQDLEGKGIIQIRPTNMNSNRELIFDKNVRISPEEGQDYSR